MIMSKNAFFFVFKTCIIESLSPMLRSIGVLRHCSIVCISSGRAWDSSRIFHWGIIPRIFFRILLLVYLCHVYSVSSTKWLPLFKIKMLLSRQIAAWCSGFYVQMLADPSIFCLNQLQQGHVDSCKGLSTVSFRVQKGSPSQAKAQHKDELQMSNAWDEKGVWQWAVAIHWGWWGWGGEIHRDWEGVSNPFCKQEFRQFRTKSSKQTLICLHPSWKIAHNMSLWNNWNNVGDEQRRFHAGIIWPQLPAHRGLLRPFLCKPHIWLDALLGR